MVQHSNTIYHHGESDQPSAKLRDRFERSNHEPSHYEASYYEE